MYTAKQGMKYKLKVNDIYVKELLYSLIILVFLFTNSIGRLFNTLFLDELSAFIVCFCGLLNIINLKSYKKPGITVFILTIILVFIGLVSTFLYRYQTGFFPILQDIVAVSKVPLTFCFGLYCFNGVSKKRLIKYLLVEIKLLTIIIFIFGLGNLFIDFGMSAGYRSGIKTYCFLFSHPTYLVFCLVLFICILSIQKKFSVFILMNLISILLTMRDKGFAFIVFYIFLLSIQFFKQNKYKKIKIILFALIAVGILYLISFDKLNEMYLQYGDTTARGALYIHGLELSISHFPFGTGFGTWGGSSAAENYSVLYSFFKMESIEGINPNDISYATDTYRPFIYTEFGILGFCLYILILFLIFRYFYLKANFKNGMFYVFLLVGYIIISSFFEAFFSNEFGVFTVIILLLTTDIKFVKSKNYNSLSITTDNEIGLSL